MVLETSTLRCLRTTNAGIKNFHRKQRHPGTLHQLIDFIANAQPSNRPVTSNREESFVIFQQSIKSLEKF